MRKDQVAVDFSEHCFVVVLPFRSYPTKIALVSYFFVLQYTFLSARMCTFQTGKVAASMTIASCQHHDQNFDTVCCIFQICKIYGNQTKTTEGRHTPAPKLSD